MRALLVCPGRGSYGREQLNSLQVESPILDRLDQLRAANGRPTLRALDAADRFSPRAHLAGEHASLLTFGATALDVAALDPAKVNIVGVAGNSMGWYSALWAAGVLNLDDAARLIETMGGYQENNVIGAQVLYPVTDERWLPDPSLAAQVQEALGWEGVYLSIRLGGTCVLGTDAAGLRRVMESMPKLRRGEREFPLQLPLHSAFHTPLMGETSARALRDLADLSWSSPRYTLIDGAGALRRGWADPAAIAAYTLTTQVVETFDLSACIATAMGEFAPDVVLLPGPGESLGAPVAQILIGLGWRGLRDRADFTEAQSSEKPVILSMARPAQRELVT